MTEAEVEKYTRQYLKSEGWEFKNIPRTVGQHGCDIIARHPIKRKYLFVEAKGHKKNRNQTIHNSFYTVLGEILFRMDKEGNSNNKARKYAIAIPLSWESAFKRKIKQMHYGWSLLKVNYHGLTPVALLDYKLRLSTVKNPTVEVLHPRAYARGFSSDLR